MAVLKSGSTCPASPLWGITSYFNPAMYRRRLSSYRVFRQCLSIPLVTVELSHEPPFELVEGDADILIQVNAPDVMFQKERLLNLAMEAVPDTCEAIAWLDCDVVFSDSEWPERALDALNRYVLVQPFDRLEEPDPAWSPGDENLTLVNEARSWAWHFVNRTMPEDCLNRGLRFSGCVTGGAWVARRQIIAENGLYDACIIGSGVRCLPSAAIGRPEHAARYMRFNPAWIDHYRQWADPIYQSVKGHLGYVDGTVRHVWHGNLKYRRFSEIHADFKRFDFDPTRDIATDANGVYRWSSDKPDMHRFVKEYFFSRKEDEEPETFRVKTSTSLMS